jgi:hypothetical protein
MKANKINDKFPKKGLFANKLWLIQYNKNKLSPQTIKIILKKCFLIFVYKTGKKNKEHIIIAIIDDPVIGIPKKFKAFVKMSIPLRL